MIYCKCFSIIHRSILAFLFFSIFASAAAQGVVNPCDFGAKGDGETLCTKAIQKAIDRCADAGGGTVRFSCGTWLTGTIYMRDNVTLLLDAECTILGSNSNCKR